MATIVALTLLFCAIILLGALAIIDLKHLLLPDKLVFPFFLLGIVFHVTTNFHFSTLLDIALGVSLGGGLLYAVRFVANALYKQDSLGLGDVKLMAAAGAWLGASDTLMALITGATFGIAHGLGIATYQKYKTGSFSKLSRLSLPAGPGFIAGIILIGTLKFHSLGNTLLP